MKYYVITRANTGMYCFYIRPADLTALKDEKRLVCTIKHVTFHCALMKDKLGQYYVYISKDKLKELSISEGMSVKPKLSKDTSEYQFEYPEELMEVLKSDPEAKKVFDKLTDGSRRGIISIILRIKSKDKRIERSLLIADKLRNGITSPRLM